MGCKCSSDKGKSNAFKNNSKEKNNNQSRNNANHLSNVSNNGSRPIETIVTEIPTDIVENNKKKYDEKQYVKQSTQNENLNYDLKECDSISNANLTKLSMQTQKRNKLTMFTVDPTNTKIINDKSQGLITSTEFSPKNGSSNINVSLRDRHSTILLNNTSSNNLNNNANQNVYEIYFDEPLDQLIDIDEIYYELNESQFKKYEDFLESTRNIDDISLSTTTLMAPMNSSQQQQQYAANAYNLSNSTKTTPLMEWSKLLNKNFSNYEKSSININDNKNKLYKVYKIILTLRERFWYEEIAQLYKERYTGTKNNNNMTALTFDRKMIQLHEQFRWLVNAVANIKLNNNNIIGVVEFPPLKSQPRIRRENSSGNSVVKGLNSQTGSDHNFDTSSPNKSTQYQGLQFSKHNSHTQSTMEERDGLIFMKDLPNDMTSLYWQKGFIWKGVYFRLYSKRESQPLKREMKTLKHLAIEYLQTESTAKFSEFCNMSVQSQNFQSGVGTINNVYANITDHHQLDNNNPNLINQYARINTHSAVSIILPLIACVESSSWVLLGSAVLPTKKNSHGIMDEFMQKVYSDNCSLFKNTFLLSNSGLRNYKLYSKPIEEAASNYNFNNNIIYTFGTSQSVINNIQNSSLNNPSHIQNPSFGMTNATFPANNNNNTATTLNGHHHLIMLCNSTKLLLSLPKVSSMYVIHQDINSEIILMDFPKKSNIEFSVIKQLLGYTKLDIDTTSLKRKRGMIFTSNAQEIGQNELEKPYQFEIIRFKRMGWYINMIHVVTKDTNFQVNKRAMELLSTSKTKSSRTVLGNVLIFANNLNQHTIIHPYFLSDNLFSSSFMEPQYIEQVIDPNDSPIIKQSNNKCDLKLNVMNTQLPKQNEHNGSLISHHTANFNNNNNMSNFSQAIGLSAPRASNNLSGIGSYVGIGTKLNTENDSFRKETTLNGSFKGLKQQLRDDKKFMDFFFMNFTKSIESIVNRLDKEDLVTNFASLQDLFHKKGVNMRYAWIIYVKLNHQNNLTTQKFNMNNRIKAMIGLDILIRTLKKTINILTSKKLQLYKKIWMGFHYSNNTNTSYKNNLDGQKISPGLRRDKHDDMTNDKVDFFMENYFKKILGAYINFLIKCGNEGLNEENEFYSTISTNLFLNRLRIIDHAKKLLDKHEFEDLISSNIIKEILNYPFLNANMFLDGLQHHFSLSINYEIIRHIRNDKYTFLVSQLTPVIKPTDLTIIFQNKPYITLRERSTIMLLKLMPMVPMSSMPPVELNLPSSLYKLRKFRGESQQDPHANFDCYLKDFYELPDLEVLNDWIVLLDGIFNTLYTPDGEQNYLLEAYIIQMVLCYFNENDDQASYGILEKIYAFLNGSPVCSPELTITIHTWFGILSENKSLAECEQSYMMALLTLHKYYGDPRSRGGLGIPWELFITWRLSILCRLQGKNHDAEYVEELFDATLSTLKDGLSNINKHFLNSLTINDSLYSNLDQSKIFSKPLNNLKNDQIINTPRRRNSHNAGVDGPGMITSQVSTKTNKDMTIGMHPFTHWIHHLNFDENCPKMEVINSTFQKSHRLLKWIFTYMPTFQNSYRIWETAYLRDFYLVLMQNSFSHPTSISSLSNYSLDRQASKEKNPQGEGISTPKSLSIKHEKKHKKLNLEGNLVYMFEKESSTNCKREVNGIVYAWGQNTDGQIGVPSMQIPNDDLLNDRKLKINFPRMITALKDLIITDIASGRVHSAAITISKNVLVWGCNKSLQLGLGYDAPEQVFIPTQIPNLNDIKMLSCGTEHTVALSNNYQVFSWGQGEGGLLGHGDTKSYATPKMIDALKDAYITSIVCGGLHTIAVSKDGVCYSWGRGEGGQLGIPLNELSHTSTPNDVYLTTPKKIKGALENLFVIQVACGDAHSLALTQLGTVYGWGYTNSGQLGLGISGDIYDPTNPGVSLQIEEPRLIEKLSNIRISEIFAGSTFSLFMNDRKELYGCGLNDYHQLGIEKNPNRFTTGLDNYRMPVAGSKSTESTFPKKLDCFTSIPILRVACGENHSVALGLHDKYYMLFAWGMQKQGQLGLGEINSAFSLPRSIPYLQDIMIYNMTCGAYHSMVILGDASKTFKKDMIMDRLTKRSKNEWEMIYIENKDNLDQMTNLINNNAPSDEGKIDNPKSMKKIINQ